MKKELTWEYIAGFFDGEGCIFFKQYQSKFTIVHISQGEYNENRSGIIKEIFDFLKSKRIDVRYTKRKRSSGKGFDHRVVASAATTCKDWLNEMLPYLRVKRDKAIETIKLIDEVIGAKISPRQIDEIIKLRATNIGIRKISEQTNISKMAVKNVLIKHTNYVRLK